MKEIHVVNNQVIRQNFDNDNFIVVPYTYNIYAVDLVLSITDKNIRSMYDPDEIRHAYIEAGNCLGVSVKEFIRMLKGAMHKAYIGPEIELHNRFGWCGNSYIGFKGKDAGKRKMRWHRSSTMVGAVNINAALIKEYITDGNTHLAGFGFVTGNSKVSKEVLGKGLWKKLNCNSKSRNDKICTTFAKTISSPMAPKKTSSYIGMLNDIPSTLLNKIHSDVLMDVWRTQKQLNMVNVVNKVIKHLEIPMYKIDADMLGSSISTIKDCKRMTNDFNPNWSMKRISREHAIGVKEEFRKTHGPEPFDFIEHYPATIEDEGYVATLLTSPLKVATHGKEQHHCISSYNKMISKEEYIAYKIEKDNIVTTLGIALNTSRFNKQHLGLSNCHVNSIDRIKFADMVTNRILTIADERRKFIKREPVQQALNNGRYAGDPIVYAPNGVELFPLLPQEYVQVAAPIAQQVQPFPPEDDIPF